MRKDSFLTFLHFIHYREYSAFQNLSCANLHKVNNFIFFTMGPEEELTIREILGTVIWHNNNNEILFTYCQKKIVH